MNAAFMVLELSAVQLVGCEGSGADARADFRHSGTTRTKSYDMAAAFMLSQVHGRGIHAVRTGGGREPPGHGSALGAHGHHGPGQGCCASSG
jgi:hypothetical protein